MLIVTQAPESHQIPLHKKPVTMSLDEWQVALRHQLARKVAFDIVPIEGEHPVFTDYIVNNPERGTSYKVALRKNKPGPNFCACMDFKTNGLGTCKHIEAVLHAITKNRKLARLLQEEFTPSYTSVFLKYSPVREVMLRIGKERREEFTQLAHEYFDKEYHLLSHAYDTIDRFITQAAQISPTFRCYEDALDFIIAIRERHTRHRIVQECIGNKKTPYLSTLIKTALYPYQQEGILFAVRAGRSLIADEMGLGKTIEAIGVTQFLKKEFGIRRVLIICPTSLKYQWQSEIKRFTDELVAVVDGNVLTRQKQYQQETFYTVVSYNTVSIDTADIIKIEPDVVILDEAQRIKNWKTKTAREVKKIPSRYALVLTGTPIENKLEELYSIVQFIDPFKLGSLYRFLEHHQIRDANGKIVGYQNLHEIMTLLSDIIIRRTKKDVLSQLPSRIEKNLFVPLTQEQADIHAQYADQVARLVSKWKRFGFLDEKDRQRLLIALNCMRMVCDSTYILDQRTRFDTKIAELMSILDDVWTTDSEKVVVFSQWERMTRLVAQELTNRKIGYEYLHGGIPSKNRKTLLDNFHANEHSRIFLSTDAGGVGLNLQRASLLINMDIPWNPAVLEQRIGRIHRLGQERSVTIINLIASGSIEQRILELLRFKSSLFHGVLDYGEDQIFMGTDKFKQFMKSVDHITTAQTETAHVAQAEELERTDAFIAQPKKTDDFVTSDDPKEEIHPMQGFPSSQTQITQLFTIGAELLSRCAQALSKTPSSEQLISSLLERDPATGKKYIKIPIADEQLVVNALNTLVRVVDTLKK